MALSVSTRSGRTALMLETSNRSGSDPASAAITSPPRLAMASIAISQKANWRMTCIMGAIPRSLLLPAALLAFKLPRADSRGFVTKDTGGHQSKHRDHREESGARRRDQARRPEDEEWAYMARNPL